MAHDIGTKSESSHSWNWSNDLLHYNSQEASLNLKQEEKEFYLEKKKKKEEEEKEKENQTKKDEGDKRRKYGMQKEERKDWNWEKSQKTHLWAQCGLHVSSVVDLLEVSGVVVV